MRVNRLTITAPSLAFQTTDQAARKYSSWCEPPEPAPRRLRDAVTDFNVEFPLHVEIPRRSCGHRRRCAEVHRIAAVTDGRVQDNRLSVGRSREHQCQPHPCRISDEFLDARLVSYRPVNVGFVDLWIDRDIETQGPVAANALHTGAQLAARIGQSFRSRARAIAASPFAPMRATGDGSIRPLTGPGAGTHLSAVEDSRHPDPVRSRSGDLRAMHQSRRRAYDVFFRSGQGPPVAPPHPMGEKSAVAKNLPGRRTGIPRNVQEMQVPTSAHIVALGASSRSSSCVAQAGGRFPHALAGSPAPCYRWRQHTLRQKRGGRPQFRALTNAPGRGDPERRSGRSALPMDRDRHGRRRLQPASLGEKSG